MDKKPSFLALIVSAFLLLSPPLSAHFESDLDIAGMTLTADFVFKGIVVNVEYRSSESVPLLDPTGRPIFDEYGNPVYADGSNMPHTFVTYRVEQVYKGPPQSPTELTLRFEGGASDNRDPEERSYLFVEMYPLFKVGDRDILFVEGNTEYPCPLAGCSSGRLRILPDEQYPDNNFLFSDLGMEIRAISPAGVPVRSWQIVYGPQHIRSEITTIIIGDLELEAVFVNPTEGLLPPPEDNPRGTRFSESQFDSYLANLVSELFTPEQLRLLPPVASADIIESFRGYTIVETPEPPAFPPDPCANGGCEPERPWLAELLTPDQLAAVLEAEQEERRWLAATGGNPVLPETPCERHIVLYGALHGDISGPEGKPDCVVNMHDLAVIGDAWLQCIDDGNECL